MEKSKALNRSHSSTKNSVRPLRSGRRPDSPIFTSEKVLTYRKIYENHSKIFQNPTKKQNLTFITKSGKSINYKISTQQKDESLSSGKISENLKNSKCTDVPQKHAKKEDLVTDHSNLPYEILKAKSDLLELKRDLSLYQHNFMNYFWIDEFSQKIKKSSNAISNSMKKIINLPTTAKLLDDIEKVIKKNDKELREDHHELAPENVFTENFALFPAKEIKGDEFFAGAVEISGIKCMCYIHSKMSKHHLISCFANNKHMKLNIVKNLNDLSIISSGFKEILKKSIFPYLWLYVLKSEISLKYEKNKLNNATFLVAEIKGLGLVTLKLSVKNRQFLIEIPFTSVFFAIETTDFCSNFENFTQISENPLEILSNSMQTQLKRVLKQKLLYKKHQFFWIDSKNPFEKREKSSFFLNATHILELFQNYMKKIFKFYIRVKGKIFKIIGYDNQELRILHQNQKIVILKNSPEFLMLFNLQSPDHLFNHFTLMKSLELKFLLIRLFKY